MHDTFEFYAFICNSIYVCSTTLVFLNSLEMINIELDEKVSEREQASDTDGEKKKQNEMKWRERNSFGTVASF